MLGGGGVRRMFFGFQLAAYLYLPLYLGCLVSRLVWCAGGLDAGHPFGSLSFSGLFVDLVLCLL